MEQPSNLGLELVALVQYPTVGYAQDPVPSQLDARVAPAIGFECVQGAVVSPAVELHCDSVLPPYTVDLVPGQGHIDGRDRQDALTAILQEPLLEG